MKKNIGSCIILFFLAVSVMIGCGKQTDGKEKSANHEQTSSGQESPIHTDEYAPSGIALETKDGNKAEQILITQEEIFYTCTSIKENITCWEMYRMNLKDIGDSGADNKSVGDAERIPLPEKTGSISKLFSDKSGNIYILGSKAYLAGETGGYFVAKYSIDGSWMELGDTGEEAGSLGNIGKEESPTVAWAGKGKEDIVYLAGFGKENKVWSVDGKGSVINTFSFGDEEVWDIAAAEDGSLYAAIKKKEGNDICRVDFETGRSLNMASLPQGQEGGRLFADASGRLLYSGHAMLYEVNTQTGNLETIFTWTDSGFMGKNVKTVNLGPDGVISAAVLDSTQSGKFTLLRLIPGSSRSEKKTIILGCTYESQELLKLVGRFNTSQESYNLEIRTYSLLEDRKRLEAEIISGAGPDLIDMGLLYIKEYVNKNLLEDLNLYLDKSQSVKRENLIESVLRVNTVDGVLTCIPSAFMIDILAGKASQIGDRDRWTIEEFKEYVSSHKGSEIFEGVTYGYSREMIVLMDIWAKESKYIDWENRQVHFESEEFIDLLRFAEEYTSKTAVDNTPTSLKLQDGRVLLYNMGIRNMEEYNYQKGIFQGDIVHIGYPGQDEEYNYGIMTEGAYGILSSSKQKEGAWSFIEFLIQDTTSGELPFGEFPIQKSALEQHFKESTIENTYLDADGSQVIRPKAERSDGGTAVEIYAATREDIQKVRTMIENITYVKYNDTPVTSIVMEEIALLFNKKKTPEETARVIQNRIQLYVNETAK